MIILPNTTEQGSHCVRMEGNTIVWSASYRYPLGPSKLWVRYTEDDDGVRTQPTVTTNAFSIFGH